MRLNLFPTCKEVRDKAEEVGGRGTSTSRVQESGSERLSERECMSSKINGSNKSGHALSESDYWCLLQGTRHQCQEQHVWWPQVRQQVEQICCAIAELPMLVDSPLASV
jgi:hypothetical protein